MARYAVCGVVCGVRRGVVCGAVCGAVCVEKIFSDLVGDRFVLNKMSSAKNRTHFVCYSISI